MSKKLGKLLLLTAAVSTAAAAVAYYLHKKNTQECDCCEDCEECTCEDAADSEDSEIRSYVTLGKENAADTCGECWESIIEEPDAPEAAPEEVIEKTEEFFDTENQ